MGFLRLPPPLHGLAISIEKEIGRILHDRHGIGMNVGQIGSSREMAAQAGRRRPTECDSSSSSSSSNSVEWMEQLQNNQQLEQQQDLQKRKDAFDEAHNKLDNVLRGVSSRLGPFFDNSYKVNSTRGEHYYLYRRRNSQDDGQHTTAPDIEADSNLFFLMKVTKEVIDSFLAEGEPGQQHEYDLASNNPFRNVVASTIYNFHGNASETSNAEGRGEGGGQLPMDANSTFKYFCKLFGVEWKEDSWQRVTESWPCPDGVRIGVIGIGFGEEWLLIVEGWRALKKVDGWGSAVPALKIVGFEIDEAVSKKFQQTIETLKAQDVVSCFTADFFEFGVLAEFDSSIVRKFQLSHFYTTAAVSEAFALHIYMFGILHGLVIYTDAFNKDHFLKAYKTAYPKSANGVVNPDRLTTESLPLQMCIAYVRGGDGIVSRRPIFEWNCNMAMDAAARLAIVKKLGRSIKFLTEDTWERSKGSHSEKFGRHINALLDPSYYRSKFFL